LWASMKDYDKANSHSVLMIGSMDTILHQIRLRGPWQVVSPAGELLTLTVPFEWRDVFGEEAGTIRCTRKFNCPTGLEPENRVLISLPEDCGEVSEFDVNQVSVSCEPHENLDFDITDSLQEFNELVVTIEFNPTADAQKTGGLPSPVLIKIMR